MAATPASGSAQQIFQVHFPPQATFSLTSTMLQHDRPSMFSRVFLPSDTTGATFSETASQKITIHDKSPVIFTIIMDYLRGYNVFPLTAASLPPMYLPLSKTYENLRRDANYYGFLKLEAECTKWMKRHLEPGEKQASLFLDFAPFAGKMDGALSLLSDMILECHLSDVSLLRKRYLRSGGKNLTYGPMPWKSIFDQIRDPIDRDGVLQLDGSAFVEVAPVFLKPPRAVDDSCDERKMEYAKIHISRDVTQLILAGARSLSMSNCLTLRFHATNLTTHLYFTASDPDRHRQVEFLKLSKLVGEGAFVFKDKLQREGYMMLRSVAFSENPDLDPPKEDEGKFPLDKTEKTVLEVDGKEIEWDTLCEWSRLSLKPSNGDSKLEGIRKATSMFQAYERIFGKGRLPDVKYATVSIHGSAVFTFANTGLQDFVVPRLISLKGISEATWERKRPVWQGDRERDLLPRKRPKTKHDSNDLESMDGAENGNKVGENGADNISHGKNGAAGAVDSNAVN